MSNVLFISDLHAFHERITRFRTEFSSEEQHRECIADNWNSVVKSKRDTVWVLGDSIFDERGIDWINSLNGTKKLIKGNHCLERGGHGSRLYECFEEVYGLHTKYGCWMSHAPIHPQELRGKPNIHGHTHNELVIRGGYYREEYWEEPDPNYINVCCEQIDYTPVDLNWIRDKMKGADCGN